MKLKAGETGGPYKNRVYGNSTTMARDMRSGCSVSTLGTPQFSPSQPSLTVEELVEQRVGALTAEMKAKYEAQEKKLEEIMTKYEAYFSCHYPLPYEPSRDFPPPPPPPQPPPGACN